MCGESVPGGKVAQQGEAITGAQPGQFAEQGRERCPRAGRSQESDSLELEKRGFWMALWTPLSVHGKRREKMASVGPSALLGAERGGTQPAGLRVNSYELQQYRSSLEQPWGPEEI